MFDRLNAEKSVHGRLFVIIILVSEWASIYDRFPIEIWRCGAELCASGVRMTATRLLSLSLAGPRRQLEPPAHPDITISLGCDATLVSSFYRRFQPSVLLAAVQHVSPRPSLRATSVRIQSIHLLVPLPSLRRQSAAAAPSKAAPSPAHARSLPKHVRSACSRRTSPSLCRVLRTPPPRPHITARGTPCPCPRPLHPRERRYSRSDDLHAPDHVSQRLAL